MERRRARVSKRAEKGETKERKFDSFGERSLRKAGSCVEGANEGFVKRFGVWKQSLSRRDVFWKRAIERRNEGFVKRVQCVEIVALEACS